MPSPLPASSLRGRLTRARCHLLPRGGGRVPEPSKRPGCSSIFMEMRSTTGKTRWSNGGTTSHTTHTLRLGLITLVTSIYIGWSYFRLVQSHCGEPWRRMHCYTWVHPALARGECPH